MSWQSFGLRFCGIVTEPAFDSVPYLIVIVNKSYEKFTVFPARQGSFSQ